MTQYSYLGDDRLPLIETQWHNVIAYVGDELNEVRRGDYVHVTGRLRLRRFSDGDGERVVPEIYADMVQIIV